MQPVLTRSATIPRPRLAITAALPSDATLGAALWQALLVLAVIGLAMALVHLGAAAAAKVIFILCGLALAGWYSRRSPWLYITATLWFWTMTPFVRRIIDFSAGFDPTNIVLATPQLMTVFMLKDILTSPHLMRMREAACGLLSLIPMIYGLSYSLVLGQIYPAIAGGADWVSPFFYYFYLLAHYRRIHEAERPLRLFLTLNLIVVVGYGLYQYFDPPPWDAYWVVSSRMESIGVARPYELRVFGTLNAPSLLSVWLGTALLLALHFRTRLMLLILPPTAVLLMMTLVRSSIGSTVLGIMLALLLGAGKMRRQILAILVLVVALGTTLALLDQNVAERLTARMDTVNSLETDDSALARMALYRAAPGLIDSNPLGMGLGALGRGAVASNDLNNVTVDSGPLAIYLSLGWLFGSLHMFGIIVVIGQGIAGSRAARSPGGLAMAVAAAACAAGLIFVNLTGFYAALMWMCAGYACAVGAAGRETQQQLRRSWPAAGATSLGAVRP